MKWVVYLLLLANAGYFAVEYRRVMEDPPPKPRVLPRADHVNRMLLLSEIQREELRTRDLAPVAAAESTAASGNSTDDAETELASTNSSAQRCYSIGPLVDDAQIAAMRVWLMAMGGDPRLRVGERRELSRYWVFFPPLPSKEEAVQRVKVMQELGIEDLIVVPRGDMANAISLGVFSQRASLERRLNELRSHGYTPSTAPRFSTQKASWFDVTFEAQDSLSEDVIARRFSGVELSESRCDADEIAASQGETYNSSGSSRRYHYSEGAETAGIPARRAAGVP